MEAKKIRTQQCAAESASAKQKRVETQKGVAEAQRCLTEARKEADALMAQAQTCLAGAQQADAAAQGEEAEAQNQIVLAQHNLKHLSNSLLVLTHSLEHPDQIFGDSQAGASSRKRPRTRMSPTAIMFVSSNDLGAIIEKMNRDHIHMIYDFQGKVMKYLEAGDPTIKLSGVTWRNGTIHLSPAQTLVVQGKAVTLDSVSILGGTTGLTVPAGGSVSMTACEIRDAHRGVHLMGNATLEAICLKVRRSTLEGFRLEGSSTADIKDSDISGEGQKSIHMLGTSNMIGNHLLFRDITDHTLYLQDKSTATLSGCTLTSALNRQVVVKDQACLELIGCTFLNHISKDSTATVVVSS